MGIGQRFLQKLRFRQFSSERTPEEDREVATTPTSEVAPTASPKRSRLRKIFGKQAKSSQEVEAPDRVPVEDVPVESVERELETTRRGATIRKRFRQFATNAKLEDIQQILAKLPAMRRGEIQKIWPKVEALAKMLRDPKAAWKSKAIAIGALAYLISPFDAIPDIIPVAGLLDDAAVILAVVATLAQELDRYFAKTAQRGIDVAQERADVEIRKYNRIVRITLLGGIGFAILTIVVNYALKQM